MPTARSSPLIWISTSAATAGMKENATAGAWRGGEATNACAVISSPMKIRIGATAASGKQAHEQRHHADRGAGADDEAGGERIARPRAHGLVRGVADVRRVLDDATARPRERWSPAPRSAGCPACGIASPAARADSALSMPPTTVAMANGRASGRYAEDLVEGGHPRERRPRGRQGERELGRRMRCLPHRAATGPRRWRCPRAPRRRRPGAPTAAEGPRPASPGRARGRPARRAGRRRPSARAKMR